jgi:PAS domain S-box-containing protein
MSQDEKQDPSKALELVHLYERAPIALCVTDRDHRYVRINQRLCDINGKSVEEHVGRTVQEVIPHLADQIVPMFQNVIDTAEPVLDSEVSGETLSHPGEERVFLGNHFPLISEAGEVKYVHTMVRDITDQRRAEASLREANDRLEERVRARTEELVLLSEELKVEVTERARAQEEAHRHQAELAHVSRVTSMGELAASISHELNQPLTAVLTNAQTALRLIGKKAPDLEELHDILEDIVSDDKRAGEVIRRLRTLLQKDPVAKETVQLEELVSGVLPLVRSEAQGANVRIDVKSAPNLPLVEVDPVQVQQVVMNLLVNAIDAIRRLGSEGGEIEVEISPAGKHGVLVAVRDDGPGIPAEEIRDVFKPFVTSKPGGLGMGLAICKSILDAHGGTISLESLAPRGCCFSLILPLKQPVTS